MSSNAPPDRFAATPAVSAGTPPLPRHRHHRSLSRHRPPTPLAVLPLADDADGADAAAVPPTESTQRSASASSHEYGALFGLSQGRRTVSPAVSRDESTSSARSGAAAAHSRTDVPFAFASPRKKPRAANRAGMKRGAADAADTGGGGGCTPEVAARVQEYLRGVDRAGFYTVWKAEGGKDSDGGGGDGGMFGGAQPGPRSPRDRALGDLPDLVLRRLREEAEAEAEAAGRPAQLGRQLLMLLPADPAATATAALPPPPSSTHASTAAFYDPGPRPAVHRLAGASRFSQFLGLSRNGRHAPEAARFVRLCGRPAACVSRLPSLRDKPPAAAAPRQLLRSATQAHARRAGSASLHQQQQHIVRPFAARQLHPHPVPRAAHERCSSAAQQTVVVPPGTGGFWRLAVL